MSATLTRTDRPAVDFGPADFAPRVRSNGERTLTCPREPCGRAFAAWAPAAVCPSCGAIAREVTP